MTKHIQEEPPEFALTKERVLAARAADRGPGAPKPDPIIIEDGGVGVLHLHILGSGSKGNCCIVEGPTGSIMIDCGFSKKAALSRAECMGIDIGAVRGLMLTHEHSDHFSGIDVMSRALSVPVYTAEGTAAVSKVEKCANIEAIANRTRFTLAGIDITTFPTSHDAADPIGMRFECGGDVVGYATDTGVLSGEALELLSGCRILALESNHDPKMLKTGPYPSYLKARIAGEEGHLSNEQGADALNSLLCNELHRVVGMHLSENNNLPDLALSSLGGVVSDNTHGARVFVASQSLPMSVL